MFLDRKRTGGAPDYRSDASEQRKTIVVEWYTGLINRYTSGSQIREENPLEGDRTTGISDRTIGVNQICFILMYWHDFWPLDWF